MPMPAKGARLFFRERRGVWVIKDTGGFEQSTGTRDRQQAEIQLGAYIARKNRRSGPAEAGEMTVAEVLAIYGEEHAPSVADPARIGQCIAGLLPFWGDVKMSAVKGETCRRYERERGRSIGTVRKELGTLQAAANYCVREGYLTSAPIVTLPAAPETNQGALTRDEVARMLWACRKNRVRRRHLAQFILVSIYTGTRAAAAMSLRIDGPSISTGWCDLDRGILHRRGAEERVTKKRRTPTRIPRQLLSHLKRWRDRLGQTWAVEDYRGGRVAEMNQGFDALVVDAGLTWRPTPHTLKHTAITWAIEAGVSVEDASGFFGTSAQTITNVYWHLSPKFLETAVSAIENRGRAPGTPRNTVERD